MEEYLKKNVLENDDKLEAQDLEFLNVDGFDEFITIPPPTERVLMLLFIRKYLGPHFSDMTYKQVKSESLETPIYINHSIQGSMRIAPSSLPNTGKMTIKELSEDDCKLEKLSLIDLSENNLGSEDLQYVLILAEKLERENKLSKATVNLTHNRIHGIREWRPKVRLWLNRLVRIAQIEFVVLKDNPFSSVDSKDFFSCLGSTYAKPDSTEEENLPSVEILDKLIWIDRWNLFTSLWAPSLLISDEIVSDIRKTHIRYFEPENIKKSCQGDDLLVTQNDKLLGFSGIQYCALCNEPIAQSSSIGGHIIYHHNSQYLVSMSTGSVVGFCVRDWNTGKILSLSKHGNHNQ